ncbi:hypothetical protein BGZ94_008466 [Podila epigama]|nr:hypothetical protein BGZ94_008466 [Podila epigama]
MKLQPIILSLVVSCAYAMVIKRATTVADSPTGVDNSITTGNPLASDHNTLAEIPDIVGPPENAATTIEKSIQDGINTAGADASIAPADEVITTLSHIHDVMGPFIPEMFKTEPCETNRKASETLKTDLRSLTDAILLMIEDATAKANIKEFFDTLVEQISQYPYWHFNQNCDKGHGGKPSSPQ